MDEKVVVAKFATTSRHGALPGKTQSGEVMYYNLDAIISVGYRVMAQVGHAIRVGYEYLNEAEVDCMLEGNKGNHFAEPDLRTAKEFAWLMNRRCIC